MMPDAGPPRRLVFTTGYGRSCGHLPRIVGGGAPCSRHGRHTGGRYRTRKAARVLVAWPNLAPGDYNVLKMAADASVEVVVEGIFGGVRDCWRSIDGTGAIKAREDGIFMLAVESYYHTLGSDSLNTRLEAFVETLRGGLIDA